MSEVVLLCSLLQSYRLPRPLHDSLLYRDPFEGLIDYVVKLESSRTIPFPGASVSVVLMLKLPHLSPFFCGYVSAVVDLRSTLCVLSTPYLEESRLK